MTQPLPWAEHSSADNFEKVEPVLAMTVSKVMYLCLSQPMSFLILFSAILMISFCMRSWVGIWSLIMVNSSQEYVLSLQQGVHKKRES